MPLSARTQRKTHVALKHSICHANIETLGRTVKTVLLRL